MSDRNKNFGAPVVPDMRGNAWLRGLAAAGVSGPLRNWRRAVAEEYGAELMRWSLAAAQTGHKSNGWKKITDSGLDVASKDGGLVAERATGLAANNPLARRAIGCFSNMVVGQGIRSDIGIGWGTDARQNSKLNSALEDRLRFWQDEAFVGAGKHMFDGQRLWLEDTMRRGDCLVVRLFLREPGRVLPLAYQIIESSRLVDFGAQGVLKGNEVFDGVEMDGLGRAVAYHIAGDGYRMTSTRVPASDVVHHFRVDRPGQHRGISWLAPVVPLLYMLQELLEYKLVQAKVQAALAVIVSDGVDGGSGLMPGVAPASGVSGRDADGNMLKFLVPGMIHRVGKGNVSTLNPSPSGDLDPLVKCYQRLIAVGCDLSYERLTGDYKEVSFAGGRLTENNQKDSAESVWAWACRGFLYRLHRDFIDAEVAFGTTSFRGLRKGADVYAVTFSRPHWRLGVNPLQEVKASGESVRLMLSSLREEVSKSGRDMGSVIADFMRDRTDWKEAGVDLARILGFTEEETKDGVK